MASTARETPPAEAAGPVPAPASRPARALGGTPLLVAVAVLVALAFVASMLAATSGRFVPQVLDLYLVGQYAKAMAEGHPFQYNAGEAASTGATSLLHTSLLALAYRLGARGEGLIAFAVLSGALFYVLTVLIAARMATALAGRREGVLAGALVALCGPVAWGFLYGADVAPAMLLGTWLLDRMVAGWRRADRPDHGWIIAATLLALARPEALVAALVLGGAYVLGPGRALRRRGGVRPWVPALAGFAVTLLYRAVTGSWVGSSVADKSLFANYRLGDALGMAAEYTVDVVRGILLGFYPSQATIGVERGFAPLYFPPLALVLVLLALGSLRPPQGSAVRVWAVAAAATCAAVVPNTFMGVHFNRYLLWCFPSLLALAAIGLGLLTRRLAPPEGDRERAVFLCFAGLFVGLGLLSTVRFAAVYGDMAGEIARRDLPAAEWIRHNLPPGATIANLASGVEYLTGHRAVNLHGVTSAAFFGNRTAEREANTVEALSRIPAAERPPYLITSVSRQESSPVMGELVRQPALYRTLSLSDDLLIYRMRYDVLDAAAAPVTREAAAAAAGKALVDALNVCDSQDERAHGYRFVSRLGDLALWGTARVADYAQGPRVADAGRAILGSEAFNVRTQPGRDLLMVLRSAPETTVLVWRPQGAAAHPLDLAQAVADVTLDGQRVGRATFTARSGWDELALTIPARFVTRASSRLELKGRYAAFRYWFYQ